MQNRPGFQPMRMPQGMPQGTAGMEGPGGPRQWIHQQRMSQMTGQPTVGQQMQPGARFPQQMQGIPQTSQQQQRLGHQQGIPPAQAMAQHVHQQLMRMGHPGQMMARQPHHIGQPPHQMGQMPQQSSQGQPQMGQQQHPMGQLRHQMGQQMQMPGLAQQQQHQQQQQMGQPAHHIGPVLQTQPHQHQQQGPAQPMSQPFQQAGTIRIGQSLGMNVQQQMGQLQHQLNQPVGQTAQQMGSMQGQPVHQQVQATSQSATQPQVRQPRPVTPAKAVSSPLEQKQDQQGQESQPKTPSTPAAETPCKTPSESQSAPHTSGATTSPGNALDGKKAAEEKSVEDSQPKIAEEVNYC